MTNYFRITGYHPTEDFCFIMDCYGMFDELWQFSSMLVKKGLKILEVSDSNSFIDINIEKLTTPDKEHIFLRANAIGKPEYIPQTINGETYTAVKVADKMYVPKKIIIQNKVNRTKLTLSSFIIFSRNILWEVLIRISFQPNYTA